MTVRRLYIIPADADPADYLEAATGADCGEIVRGIPAPLAAELADIELPAVHVEEDPEPVDAPASDPVAVLTERLELLEAEVAALRADPFANGPT